jgi:hypothetical protein
MIQETKSWLYIGFIRIFTFFSKVFIFCQKNAPQFFFSIFTKLQKILNFISCQIGEIEF